MGKTIVISGGNSGIGLEAGRQLAKQGHHVVLLGRSATKGDAAVDSIRKAGGSAEHHACDLATHAGVKAIAEKVAAAHPKIDGLILGAGQLMMRDERTADGLHPIFAVNYLSRYHLTQRLLPQVRASSGTVVLLVARVPLTTQIDFSLFPRYQPFPGMGALSGIQIANHHYVAHLAKSEPTIRAGVVNVGLVKTEILRDMPALMRVAFTVLGPVVTIPVERSASNAVWLTTQGGWNSGRYWGKPGRTNVSEALEFDAAVTQKVVDVSRELTGC